jgi:hypothetical protein
MRDSSKVMDNLVAKTRVLEDQVMELVMRLGKAEERIASLVTKHVALTAIVVDATRKAGASAPTPTVHIKKQDNGTLQAADSEDTKTKLTKDHLPLPPPPLLPAPPSFLHDKNSTICRDTREQEQQRDEINKPTAFYNLPACTVQSATHP